MAKIKAEWPRCAGGGTITVHDQRTGITTVSPSVEGYRFAFADGTVRCTPEWNSTYYRMIRDGKSPKPRVPNLSQLKIGTPEYFKWLCRAQGPGEGPHAVRMGFDKAGLKWRADSDIKSRRSPYAQHSHTHTAVPASQILPCSLYVRNMGGNELSWVMRADVYASEVMQTAAERTEVTEHRPGYPGGPPLPVEEEGLLFGIPKLYLYGGATVAVVLAAALLKGKKR